MADCMVCIVASITPMLLSAIWAEIRNIESNHVVITLPYSDMALTAKVKQRNKVMADPPMALLARSRVKTTFGPGTVLASFDKESRTPFRQSPELLSLIFTPPKPFLDMVPPIS
jgi:hypothetical protein